MDDSVLINILTSKLKNMKNGKHKALNTFLGKLEINKSKAPSKPNLRER